MPAPRAPQPPDEQSSEDELPSAEGPAPAEGPSAESQPGPAARSHPNDPLHGLTLKHILTQLHARYGWQRLGQLIQIRCFTNDPSMGSSLAFLRRQPWARKEVEELFLRSLDSARAEPPAQK